MHDGCLPVSFRGLFRTKTDLKRRVSQLLDFISVTVFQGFPSDSVIVNLEAKEKPFRCIVLCRARIGVVRCVCIYYYNDCDLLVCLYVWHDLCPACAVFCPELYKN